MTKNWVHKSNIYKWKRSFGHCLSLLPEWYVKNRPHHIWSLFPKRVTFDRGLKSFACTSCLLSDNVRNFVDLFFGLLASIWVSIQQLLVATPPAKYLQVLIYLFVSWSLQSPQTKWCKRWSIKQHKCLAEKYWRYEIYCHCIESLDFYYVVHKNNNWYFHTSGIFSEEYFLLKVKKLVLSCISYLSVKCL